MVHVEITADDLNVVSFGDVYGDKPIFTNKSFAAHVYNNHIKLSHSLRVELGGELLSVALLAFRGTRAWVGGFGVAPGHRGIGLGQQCAEKMLKTAAQQGAQTIELEVLIENDAARRVYEKVGFAVVDDLCIWTASRRGNVRNIELIARSESQIAQLVTTPPCWQREPGTVTRSGPSALIEMADAYAFVRPSATGGLTILDAHEHDYDAAMSLCSKLEHGLEMSLINESAGSTLSRGLATSGWEVARRQYRMSMVL